MIEGALGWDHLDSAAGKKKKIQGRIAIMETMQQPAPMRLMTQIVHFPHFYL